MPRGSKPGERRGGRKRGTLNKRTQEIGSALDKLVPDKQLIQLLWKLALVEGDSRCAIYLADRKWGRIPQPMEHSGPGGGAIEMTEYRCVFDDGKKALTR